MNNTFTKAERICSKLIINKIFAGGNSSMAVFPLRIVYMKREACAAAPVSLMISVPKKRFRHAVDRNRMKRLIRESYRLSKHELCDYVAQNGYSLAIAFICIADNLPTYPIVLKSMKRALARIKEQLERDSMPPEQLA